SYVRRAPLRNIAFPVANLHNAHAGNAGHSPGGAGPVSIAVENYHKNYDQTIAVAGISFRVEPGEILGLVGPNGAGKTTTLRALAGMLRPTHGRLLVGGRRPATEPVHAKPALAHDPHEPAPLEQLTVP